MKKAAILLLLVLWVAAGVQMAYGKNGEENKIVEVLAEVGSEEQSSVVEYYGVYHKEYLELDDREVFLRQVAGELGIKDNIEVVRTYDDTREETKLIKKASKATTTMRFITLEEEGKKSPDQYVIINITMEGTMENAIGYREKLEDILEKDTRNSRSSANVIGRYDGKLSLEERNRIADGLLEKMGAHVVSENRDMQLYTIYGYTPWLKEYEMQEDDAVNINIAMYYSQTKDETYVYAAVPILGLDY